MYCVFREKSEQQYISLIKGENMKKQNMFTKDIGIDLGTANTLVYLRGKGIIIREPSVVAVNTHTDRAKYVGKEAKEVIGRAPGSIVAVRPLKDGVIADFETTTILLQEFIRKAFLQLNLPDACWLTSAAEPVRWQ